ncbi:hypothetical protein CIK52_07715 [Kocuria rosea]|uniref:Uncharacterized protein n=1 Tax=Kocuria rosea subsp. polaris TaxID=136273 RepID=A0A0A6YAG3_KOCRO|nr:hypothetical protein GY22_16340 [Kocuria polaris]PWF81496.1 hypothetical protein DEJ38_10065 [Kocuria rosea]PWF86197.1 hypothetical protein CIK52_07715 [Kocuria rosea]
MAVTSVPPAGTGPEDPHQDPHEESQEPSPKPLEDEIAESRPKDGRRFNAATFEVRLRRWALLLLVAGPAIWFLVQQLR